MSLQRYYAIKCDFCTALAGCLGILWLSATEAEKGAKKEGFKKVQIDRPDGPALFKWKCSKCLKTP